MPSYKEIKPVHRIMGRLDKDGDVLGQLTEVCKKENITSGYISAIGAVQKAAIGYYNQATRKYEYVKLEQPLEIQSIVGNVSIKDGEPMVHAHICLCDGEGNAFGGHLAEGTIVFACEFMIAEFEGEDFVREFDEPTGLTLWNL
jgi:hypothetical protein